jgi:hypothetical protein
MIKKCKVKTITLKLLNSKNELENIGVDTYSGFFFHNIYHKYLNEN